VQLSLALRLFARESRGARGRLGFLVVCLALGVGAVTGVAALVSAVDRGLRGESRQLIAADIKISSREELPEDLDALLAEVQPEASANVWELPTMLAADSGSSRLVNLKAAAAGYPFYGDLVTDPPGLAVGELGEDGALLAAELMGSLAIDVGDSVSIGGQSFEVRGAVVEEPDRLEFALSLGPRVFVSDAGLARTSLLDFGSRVRHIRLLRMPGLADKRTLDDAEEALEASLKERGRYRVESHTDAQPNVQRSLRNVERYLGLIALLSLLLGGVGVAQVVRTWIEERTQAVAIQRSLGLRPAEILRLYLLQVLVLAGIASALGVLGGLLLPVLGAQLAPDVLDPSVAFAVPPAVVGRGFGLGLLTAAIFALGPLSAVYRVSPARVLRAEAQPLPVPGWMRLGAGATLLGGILLAARLQSGESTTALVFSGGVLALTLVLVGGARAIMGLSRVLPRESFSPYLRHGIAALARPGAGTTSSVVALGLGVLVIATMLLVESRLSAELDGELPESAPSVFLVDVQPDQWEGIRDLLAEQGGAHIDSTPVSMARLATLDDTDVKQLVKDRNARGRERWVLTREQRLTWRETLADSNTLIDGEWFDSDDGVAEVSLEKRFADDLGAEVGTRLTFDLQGVPIDLVVTSLRTVDWASFEINFFLVVEPGVLEEAPHMRLAAAQVTPEAEQPLQDALVADYPNVTLLRVRPMMEKVAALLTRIATGVRVLGWVAVAAGLAILAGAVSAAGLRRGREVALLKTLGLTRGGVTALLLIEYGLVGLVAGTCGALAAFLLTWAFLERLLELESELPWATLPLFILASAVLAAVCGLASSLRALRVRPMASLR